MQPLKLIIPESFYDTQLYMGRLYAWNVDGSIATYDWNCLIESIIRRLGEPSRLPLECAFRRGDYLYGKRWDLFFRDKEILSRIVKRFERFAQSPIEINNKDLTSSLLGRQDNPLPFPHADSIMFRKRLYTVGPQGVHSAACNKQTIMPVSTRSKCDWDCPTFGLAKSRFWGLAIAAGNEGLFEYRPQYNEEPARAEDSGTDRDHRDCTSCEWMYFSIYGSSHVHPGFMLEFSHESTRRRHRQEREPDGQRRHFAGTRQADQIFTQQERETQHNGIGYTWGAHDKICRFADRRIEVVRFNPWTGNEGDVYEPVGELDVMAVKGGFVCAQTALFGFVVEFDRCLVVIDSETLQPMNLWDEPVNWRVFRHSKYYANQLHVMYDNRIEVFSFNQDFLQDQSAKLAGYAYSDVASA